MTSRSGGFSVTQVFRERGRKGHGSGFRFGVLIITFNYRLKRSYYSRQPLWLLIIKSFISSLEASYWLRRNILYIIPNVSLINLPRVFRSPPLSWSPFLDRTRFPWLLSSVHSPPSFFFLQILMLGACIVYTPRPCNGHRVSTPRASQPLTRMRRSLAVQPWKAYIPSHIIAILCTQ
jgi:hypothetical protein